MVAAEFRAWSDRRLTKDFQLSNSFQDLNTLKQLEVTNYHHRDQFMYGEDLKKGFIAQQVAEVFPEAVVQSKGFLPNIMAPSTKIDLVNGAYQITLDQAHKLTLKDKVKIMVKDGELKLAIHDIIDDHTFSIKSDENKFDQKVFVYGKEVDDLHSVCLLYTSPSPRDS